MPKNQSVKTEKSDHPTLTLSSPLEYQVFQRSTRLQGDIIVRGSAPTATRVEARVEGTSLTGPLPGKWHHLVLDSANHQFSGQLPVIAGGFYRVEAARWRRRDFRHRRSVQLHQLRRSPSDDSDRNGHQLQRNGMDFSPTTRSPASRTTVTKAVSFHPSATPSIAATMSPSASPPSATVPPAFVSGSPQTRPSRSCPP